MRVALVIRRLDPARGGAEVWTTRLAASLLDRRYRVLVVSEHVSGEVPSRIEHIPVRLRSATGAGRRLEFAEQAAAIVDRLRPDIVHDQGDGWCFDLLQPHGGARERSIQQNLSRLPRPLARLRGALQEWLPRYRAFRTLEHRQYRQPDRQGLYVAVSDLVAQDFRTYYGIPDSQIRVVYNGVDLNHFNPFASAGGRSAIRQHLGIDRAAIVFCLVAVNFRLKGGHEFLQALARLVRKGHHVAGIVVGSRPGRAVHRLIRRLGIANRVHFVGPVKDPRPYYAASDVYVHPTYSDACSLVALEAMAMELPVITTRFNGAAELVRRFNTGFVLDSPADIQGLATAMALSCDRAWRALRREAAAAARPFLSWERNFSAITALYEEVLARRLRRAC